MGRLGATAGSRLFLAISLIWLVWLSWCSPANAAEIRWSGAEDCRREAEVREQIEAMTTRPLAGVDRFDFELELAKVTAGFQLQLVSVNRVSGAREIRVLHGGSCAEVTDAAAVAIALAIGAPASEAATGSDGEAPAAAAPAASRQEDRPDAAARRAASLSPARARWAVGLDAIFDSSVLPHPEPGGALHGSFEWRALV
jgi:hypothetical protein